MNKRTNIVRVFLKNGTAVDIEVADDYSCLEMGRRAEQGATLAGPDYYIPGSMVACMIRLFAAGQPETVN